MGDLLSGYGLSILPKLRYRVLRALSFAFCHKRIQRRAKTYSLNGSPPNKKGSLHCCATAQLYYFYAKFWAMSLSLWYFRLIGCVTCFFYWRIPFVCAWRGEGGYNGDEYLTIDTDLKSRWKLPSLRSSNTRLPNICKRSATSGNLCDNHKKGAMYIFDTGT